jgi:hypothetical protein
MFYGSTSTLREYRKYIATAKVVNPSEVASRASEEGYEAHPGAIFVSIPEMGFEEPDLIYCRYGLPIPYLKIQKDWRIWVEPTVDDDSRFCYTGIVDCGPVIPQDADQMVLTFLAQIIYASTAGTLHLSKKDAEEPFVLGNKLKAYIDDYIDTKYNMHTHPYVDSPVGPSVTSPPSAPAIKPTDILSTKIFGE